MNIFIVLVGLIGTTGRVLAALALVFFTQGAWASASCSGGGQVVTITMPAKLAVPRDTPAGTALTSWINTPSQTNFYTCVVTNSTFTGMIFQPTYLTKTGQTYVSGGVTYSLFATGVPGIGMAVSVDSYINGCGWYATWSDLGTPGTTIPGGWVGAACNANGTVTNGGRASVIFVTTGPVSPGATVSGTVFQGASYDNSNGWRISPGTNRVSYAMTSTAVTVPSCVTPGVTIPMGTHMTTELTGIGTTTSTVSFNISVNNCPAGMHSISYRIDPTTQVISSANSVVAFNGTSAATGAGVQLLNNSGTPFPLGTNTALSAYNASTGGSYTIPMKARYYQTAATVMSGTANTSMTVTFSYL